MAKPRVLQAVRPRVALRRNNVIRPIASSANALCPIAFDLRAMLTAGRP